MTPKLTPVNLWRQAQQFLAAARREFEESGSAGISLPGYFLAARSIELVLKSYLLLRGVGEKQLRSIGHDLIQAYHEARSAGLADQAALNEEIEASISWINAYYQSKDLEYPKTGLKSYPEPVALMRCAQALIDGLETEIRKWRP
jgi:HEPN domain-containing protein